MNIKELKAMMEQDAIIQEDKLASEAVNTHRLYNKYQNIFYDLSNQIIEFRQKMNKKKLELYEYWLGKAPDEVYKLKPKNKSILKGEVDFYIKGDEEYCNLETKLQKLELLAKMVDDYLKQISSRNFAIKNAIDYKKFENGGY